MASQIQDSLISSVSEGVDGSIRFSVWRYIIKEDFEILAERSRTCQWSSNLVKIQRDFRTPDAPNDTKIS